MVTESVFGFSEPGGTFSTPNRYLSMKSFYVYYSYEEWGRGYIGSRECCCSPEADIKYFGSYGDKSFSPTQKTILFVCSTREEAIKLEILLHNYFEVDINPHFANKARQTSEKFSFKPTDYAWATNGLQEVKLAPGEPLPEGFKPGRILEEKSWYTDGESDIWVSKGEKVPEGFKKGRSLMIGDNNPQHGTMWITNGEENRKTPSDQEVPNGWRRGMTFLSVKKIWINDGFESKQLPATDPLPEGWVFGRVMPWASMAGKSKKMGR